MEDLSSAGNFLLTDGLVVLAVTGMIVSICTSAVRLNVNTERIIGEKKTEIADIEREGMERWSGCQKSAEETDSQERC